MTNRRPRCSHSLFYAVTHETVCSFVFVDQENMGEHEDGFSVPLITVKLKNFGSFFL